MKHNNAYRITTVVWVVFSIALLGGTALVSADSSAVARGLPARERIEVERELKKIQSQVQWVGSLLEHRHDETRSVAAATGAVRAPSNAGLASIETRHRNLQRRVGEIEAHRGRLSQIGFDEEMHELRLEVSRLLRALAALDRQRPLPERHSSTPGGINGSQRAVSGAIAGTITENSTGLPIDGIQVNINDADGNPVAMATTDAFGDYLVTGLDTGDYFAVTYNYRVYLDELYDDISCPSGRYCDFSSGTAIPVVDGSTTSNIDFGLDKGGTLSGVLTEDGTGTPLGSKRVDLYNSDGDWVSFGFTEPSGFYYGQQGLLTGNYFALGTDTAPYLNELYDDILCVPWWSCDTTAGTPIAVTQGATTSGIDFVLALGGSISGTITDEATGSTLAGVDVDIYDAVGSWVTGATTDGAGNYETLDGLLTAPYYAVTRNDAGYVDELYDGLPCPGGNCDPTTGTPIAVTQGSTSSGVDFALALGGRVTGTVTDEDTGLPLEGLWVEIFGPDGNWASEAITDASGHYDAGSLPTDTYSALTWEYGGYLRELYDDILCVHGWCDPSTGTPIAVTQGSTTSGVDFALALGGNISGTVIDEDTGLPLAGVVANIYDDSGNWTSYGWTDASGYYEAAFLLTGTYHAVTWNDLGFIGELYDDIPCPGGSCDPTTGTPIVVTQGSTSSGIDFALVQGGFISGTVTEDVTALPLEDVEVGIFNEAGDWVGGFWTDAAGDYLTTSGLLTGTYYARTWNSAGYLNEYYDDISCIPWWSCDPTTATPIAVTQGSTTLGIDFALVQGGVISGTITEQGSGLPLENAGVDIFNDTGNWLSGAWTDAAGNYQSADGLPTGTYNALTWNTAGYVDELYDDILCPGGNCDPTTGTPIAVTQGSTTPGIDFALSLGGRISGTITDHDTGLPLANVEAAIFDDAGNWMDSAWTDPSGNYLTPGGVPSGNYHALTWNNQGYVEELYDDIPCPGGYCNPTTGTPVPVIAGSISSGTDFALAQGGRISGALTSQSSGRPIDEASVDFYDSSGDWMGWGDTDAAGTYECYFVLPAADYFAVTWNDQGFDDELYDDIACPNGNCDPTTGTPIGVTQGFPTLGIDFALAGAVFMDGFESGDTSAWSRTVP